MARNRRSSKGPHRLPPLERGTEPVRENGSAMCPPNHLVSTVVSVQDPFPMLRLRGREDHDPRQWKLLFFHPRYGEPFYDFQPRQGPPTWMDPSLFVAMAEEDPRVQALQRRGLSDHNRRELVAILQDIFSERYLDYLFGAFHRAAPYLAEWLLVRATELAETEEGLSAIMESQARRRVQSGTAPTPDKVGEDYAQSGQD